MSKKQKCNLDKSWKYISEYSEYNNSHPQIKGMIIFQNKALEDLNAFMKTITGPSLADTCFKEGIFKAIQIIKELKA